MAMAGFAGCDVDLFLSGHLHVSGITHTVERYKIRGHAALVVQAGTATSTRRRAEVNSWNLLRIEHPWLTIERFDWSSERRLFEPVAAGRFKKTVEGWSAANQEFDDAHGQRSA